MITSAIPKKGGGLYTLSYSIQPASSSGYKSKCSAGNKPIFIDVVDGLANKVQQYEIDGDTAVIEEQFAHCQTTSAVSLS